ncbi:hypothetical protein BCR42DRAFT_413828 [Absidia repens]|uniref:Uncharacterized protein n=1 Tax=Absidia repens TaxID=90262 RepID=A0A1X2IIE8_9FUNG|nr:hypothetical protein BCR42DRAFT_413828 [Absidia repens]
MINNDVFLSFTQYDFDKDERFQAGVSSIMNKQEGDKDEMLEKAKWFYYTKFVEAFDFNEYQKWKTKVETTEETERDQTTTEGSTSTTMTANGDQVTVPPKLSFQQIVEMIETGQEIPGIRQIPDKLNEGEPSQPKLKARPKPWEQKIQ